MTLKAFPYTGTKENNPVNAKVGFMGYLAMVRSGWGLGEAN